MSEDPDLPKASYALQVLRQARLSRNETAAMMVGDLVYEMARTGLRTPEIEEAREAAWVAISALANALKEERFAGPTIWKAALKATELDRIVDLRSRCPRSERPLFGVSAYPVMTGIEEIHVLLSNHCETTLLMVM